MLKFFILAAYLSVYVLGQGVHTDLNGVHTSIISSDPPSFTKEPARNNQAGGVHTDLLNPPKVHTRILGKRAVNIRESSFNSSTRLLPALERRALLRPAKKRKHLNISIRIRLPSLPRRRPKKKHTRVRVLVKRQIPVGSLRHFGLTSEPRHLVRRELLSAARRHRLPPNKRKDRKERGLVRRQIPPLARRPAFLTKVARKEKQPRLVRRQRPIRDWSFGLTSEPRHLVKRQIPAGFRHRFGLASEPQHLVRRQIPSLARRPPFLNKVARKEKQPRLVRRQRPIRDWSFSGLTSEPRHLVRRQIPAGHLRHVGLTSEPRHLVRRELLSAARRHRLPPNKRKDRKERGLVRRQLVSLNPPHRRRMPTKRADRLQ